MLVPFEEISDNSRLWIYQGTRPFSADEIAGIANTLRLFCEQWAAHGHPLKTSFLIAEDQFIILAADESFGLPSGCSIDSSVHVIKDIETNTGLDLLNRSQVAFYIDSKVTLLPMAGLKEDFASRRLTGDTLTFNTLAATKAEWRQKWRTAVRNTWLARYLPKTVVAE